MLVEQCLGKGLLFRAPLEKPVYKVLDIGTGNGQWAMDYGTIVTHGSTLTTKPILAGHYPNSYVIGVDISPIQPL